MQSTTFTLLFGLLATSLFGIITAAPEIEDRDRRTCEFGKYRCSPDWKSIVRCVLSQVPRQLLNVDRKTVDIPKMAWSGAHLALAQSLHAVATSKVSLTHHIASSPVSTTMFWYSRAAEIPTDSFSRMVIGCWRSSIITQFCAGIWGYRLWKWKLAWGLNLGTRW